MSNVYYTPGKFGLEIVDSVEFSDRCYQFDTSVIWQHKDSGQLYVADDSGCSCPLPFESFGVDDLLPVNTTQELIQYFEDRKRDSYYYGDDDDLRARIDAEIGAAIGKARDAMAARK